jgi:hypothetical protein
MVSHRRVSFLYSIVTRFIGLEGFLAKASVRFKEEALPGVSVAAQRKRTGRLPLCPFIFGFPRCRCSRGEIFSIF